MVPGGPGPGAGGETLRAPAASLGDHRPELVATLGARERYRDEYWDAHDPIVDDRLRWRAQTLRHMVHLLPSQTILELGCGQGRFTRQLIRVTRGENPITAAPPEMMPSSTAMMRTNTGSTPR